MFYIRYEANYLDVSYTKNAFFSYCSSWSYICWIYKYRMYSDNGLTQMMEIINS